MTSFAPAKHNMQQRQFLLILAQRRLRVSGVRWLMTAGISSCVRGQGKTILYLRAMKPVL